MTRSFWGTTILGLILVACAAESDELTGGRQNQGGDELPPGEQPVSPGDPTQPGNCAVGNPHVGFGNHDFASGRVEGGIGADRRRVKPYSAIRTEFQRVHNALPPAMAISGAAYGDVPARWYIEPTAGAVSLYTTYSLAFTGCYDTMTDPKFTQAPTTATADTECAAMQRRYWQRTATPDEVKACSDLAVTGLTTEPVARRRWAHACASIMTAAGFTTY
jgi:hypothetical protein